MISIVRMYIRNSVTTKFIVDISKTQTKNSTLFVDRGLKLFNQQFLNDT